MGQDDLRAIWREINNLKRCKMSCGTSVGKWEKYTITFSDFAIGATSNTINLRELGTDEMVLRSVIVPRVAFSGGAISAYTISIGNSALGVAIYQSPTSVFTGVTVNAGNNSTINNTRLLAASSYITARSTSTTANLDAATQGVADIYFQIAQMPA